MESTKPTINRRDFLKALSVTAVAATATGAGAATLANQSATTTVPAAPLSAPIAPISPASNANAIAATNQLTQLAHIQAENMRLQAALDAATRQIETLQSTNDTNQALQVELGSANEQVSLLAGLVALYEQLDEVDVEGTVNSGMLTVSNTMLDLLDQLPTLEDGITLSQDALDELESHIPSLTNGRIWLGEQVNSLDGAYQNIEQLLQQTAETIKPVLDMINDWVQDLLKWLPFNLGNRTSNIVQAITDLLTQTPTTLSGLQNNIANPLDVWLSGSDDSTPLQQNLVKPIREKLIVKAGEAASKAQQLQIIYETELTAPVKTAVDNRQAVATAIADYRNRHQV